MNDMVGLQATGQRVFCFSMNAYHQITFLCSACLILRGEHECYYLSLYIYFLLLGGGGGGDNATRNKGFRIKY